MSNSSTNDYIVLLNKISININLYMTSFLFIFGIINCVMVLIIFFQPEYRRSPCTVYIIAKPIYDIIGLFIMVLMRFYTAVTGIDPSQTIEIWCKGRISLFCISTFGSLSCIYLTGFDRWMSTSRSVRRRNLSSRRIAFYAIAISLFIGITLTGIPMYIIIGFVGTPSTCAFLTLSYADYSNFFFYPIVFGVVPVVIPIMFALLTYQNVRSLQHRVSRIEKQFTRMILLQLIALTSASIPYATYYLYIASTRRLSKNSLRLAQENLWMTIVRNLFYINYVYSFYIFAISSSEIRKTLKRLISRIFHYQNEITVTTRAITVSNRQFEPIINNRTFVNPILI